MSDVSHEVGEDQGPVEDERTMPAEISVLDVLLILARRIKFIAACCAVMLVVASLGSLLLADVYTATTRVVPAGERQRGVASPEMTSLAALAGVSVGENQGALFAGMAQSRTVAEAIIARFKLLETWGFEHQTDAYVKWRELLDVSLGGDDGILTIKVDDGDPKRAAEMANAVVDELKLLNVRLNLSTAGRERTFLQERLDVVRNDLQKAEDKLKEFQQTNKAVRIDAQAEASIDAISRIQAEIASKEVQLGMLLSVQTERHPEVRALREEIRALKKQLAKVERSTGEDDGSADDLLLEAMSMPELGVRYARLMREFKIQEQVFGLLTQQLEVAKLEEAKNMSSIEVIDPAVAPDLPSKPNRMFIVILLVLLTGFFGVLFVFWQEYYRSLPLDEQAKWRQLGRFCGIGAKRPS